MESVIVLLVAQEHLSSMNYHNNVIQFTSRLDEIQIKVYFKTNDQQNLLTFYYILHYRLIAQWDNG